VTLRYVDTIAALDIDSTLELDIRVAWKPTRDLEVFIVGQNLLHDQHAEFQPMVIPTVATEVERGVYGGVTWHF